MAVRTVGDVEPSDPPSPIGRRRFLGVGALGGAGLVAGRRSGSAGADRLATYARLNRVNSFTADNLFGSGRPWVDVRAFGAVGDGVADDTAAMQAAVDSLHAAGGVVFVPQGLYCITAPLQIHRDDTVVRGVGRGTEIFAGPAWAGSAL